MSRYPGGGQKPWKNRGPKGEERAARRTGKISARQQKKLRRQDPRLTAPKFYGMDLAVTSDEPTHVGPVRTLGEAES